MNTKLIAKHQKPAQPLVLKSSGRKVEAPQVNISNYTSAPNWKDLTSGVKSGAEFVERGTQQIREQGAAAQAAAEKSAKTAQRARSLVAKKTKVPMKVDENYENIVKMQQALYDQGYFGNISLNKAVDGKIGNMTRKALAKAQKDGYTWNGNALMKNKEVIATPGRQDLIDRMKTGLSNGIYDNLYPYSYGDIYDEETGKYRQVTGRESATEQAKSGFRKVTEGVKGMDPRREMMNKMASIDLSTDEGWAAYQQLIKEANNMNHQMVRYNARNRQQAINQQWEMRARLDAMNLYQGRPQQWNTYIEQQDKSKLSGRATRAGKPTLIIRDTNQRNRINGELLNYWNSHPSQRVKGENGLYRMPVMSYLGNATIAQQEDGSLRYADDWDYTWSTKDDPNRPYFGEVLSDFSGKGYGTGVNGHSFSEGMNDLASGIYEEQVAPKVDDIKSTISNMFSKGTQFLSSAVNRYKFL